MKLIIDISEEVYKASQITDIKYADTIQIPLEVIANGIPLDKIRDVISRQAVLDLVVENHTELNGLNVVMYSPLYKDIKQLPSVNPQEPKYCDRNICVSNEYNGIGCDECEVTKSREPSVEILKTEESNDNDTKYLNINVSDDEVKRNPDIVRLCSDAGLLEYVRKESE